MDIYVVHDQHGKIIAGGTSAGILSGKVKLAAKQHQHYRVFKIPDAASKNLHHHVLSILKGHRVQFDAKNASLVPKS